MQISVSMGSPNRTSKPSFFRVSTTTTNHSGFCFAYRYYNRSQECIPFIPKICCKIQNMHTSCWYSSSNQIERTPRIFLELHEFSSATVCLKAGVSDGLLSKGYFATDHRCRMIILTLFVTYAIKSHRHPELALNYPDLIQLRGDRAKGDHM